jgi:uncharacterized membrane protein
MPGVSELTMLSVVNWFHLVATVAWIGGIFINLIVISPAARESLEPPAMGRFMGSFVKRFRVLVYISMGVLVVTGVFMMLWNKLYAGGMDFGSPWVLFVVLKHIFVLILIILGIYILQVVAPKVERLGAKGPSPKLAKAQKLQVQLAITTVIIGLVILVFTAITGAISVLV